MDQIIEFAINERMKINDFTTVLKMQWLLIANDTDIVRCDKLNDILQATH